MNVLNSSLNTAIENKSNSTAVAMREEATLPETSAACPFLIADAYQENIWPWTWRSRSWSITFTMVSFHLQISTCIKVILGNFVASFQRFQNSWSWKCSSRSGCTTFSTVPFNGKYQTFYQMTILIFAFSSVYLSQQPLEKFDLENLGHGSQSTIFAVKPFDGKCQKPTTTSFFTFLIFAKVRPVLRKVTNKHRQTHSHRRNRQAHSNMKGCRFAW